MAEDKRTNGQLWIDKKTNSLRYKSADKQFSLSANESLKVNGDITSFKVGNLVAINNEGKLKLAVFPDDLENVVGVIGITPDSEGKTFVTKQGTVTISKNVFYTTATDETEQLKAGLPVYWFISDYFSNNNTDSYQKPGMLTTLTPSGFKGFAKEYTGEKGYNVGYDNLPQVGIITSVDTDKDTVTVYVNIDKFDTSIEWNYPYLHGADNNLENAGCNEYEPNNDNEVTINIYHGLFRKDRTNDPNEFIPKCRCSIVGIKVDGTSRKEYTVLGSSNLVSESVDNTDKGTYTQVKLKTSERLRYRISGVINYKYDKDHENKQ